MGEYFVLVNEDRREYVCPYCLGHLGKLQEWPVGEVVPFLISIAHRGYSPEFGGRWAGERIALVGDATQAVQYGHIHEAYRNISLDLAAEMSANAWATDFPDAEACDDDCEAAVRRHPEEPES